MGLFRIDIEVAVPGRHARWTPIRDVVVDTGAELTWLPEDVLRGLGVETFKTHERFLTADGRLVRRDLGIALVRHGRFKTVDEIVFAKPGDLTLLGAHTLEGFNATVDPRRRRLVAGGPMPAACASTHVLACHQTPC